MRARPIAAPTAPTPAAFTPAAVILASFVLLAAAGCAGPPPEAYGSTGAAARLESRAVGANQRGEACQAQAGQAPPLDLPTRRAEEAFCGGWTQPAARVFSLAGSVDLDAVSADGPWRRWIDQRYACGAPQPTTLATGLPARLLACTRRSNGSGHLALAVTTPGGTVLADGLPASLPVVERMITGATVTGGVARSEALQIAISRLAADRIGAADEARFERLMLLGEELNQTEDFAGAEDAYRQALAERTRMLRGRDEAELARPLMHVALNLSNQGRFQEAQRLFLRAEALVPGAADRTAAARLQHYRGVQELNRNQLPAAAERLALAEAGYRALLPPRRPSVAGLAISLEQADPQALSAALGLAEVLRYRAVVASGQGDSAAINPLLAASRRVLADAGVAPGLLEGRNLRVGGVSLVRADSRGAGIDNLNQAGERFAARLPGERPVATTRFVAGRALLADGRPGEALAAFRDGAAILRQRRIGLGVADMLFYVDALERAALRDPAQAQALRAEAFGAAQLGRRSEAARFLAQASARLGSAGGDERVANALRRRQDIDLELRSLLGERDGLIAAERPTTQLDLRIAERRAAREEAEEEAAQLAPEYRQLLVETIEAGQVAALLGSDEALVQFMIGPDFSYALALRRGQPVTMARLAITEREATEMIRAVRRSMDAAPVDGGQPASFDVGTAAALYDRLLKPVEAVLDGAGSLVVVPDGPLLGLPFGMLLTSHASADNLAAAPWLIRRHAISHAPSVQSLASLRRRSPASTAARPFIGFGDFLPPSRAQLARSFPEGQAGCGRDAQLASELGRLPNSAREIQLAAGAMGRDSVIRLGAAFTRETVAAANLQNYRVVHFATHGLLPGDLSCLLEPAILVSGPRGAPDAAANFMTASAIMALRMDADLVLLSACNTAGPGVAGGSDQSAEALSGLAKAFFFAGARGLLATHWNADDRAATIIMARTLAFQAGSDPGASSGTSSARALQAAQLALLSAASGELAHPYFWAAFALIGDGRRAEAQLAQSAIR